MQPSAPWQRHRSASGSTGSENIPRHGGALLAYNHVSVLDAIFLGLSVTRRGRIVRCFALSEDFERPLLGRALRGLRQVPIRRGAGVWGPLEQLADVVTDGWLAGIAPEGTVGGGEELLPIQKGAARIALLAGSPVIPVGLWGPQRRWPKAGLRMQRPFRPTLGRLVRPTDLRGGRTPEVTARRAGAHRSPRRGAVRAGGLSARRLAPGRS